MARLKIIYLIAVSLAIFLVHDPRFLVAALVVHLVLAIVFRIGWRQFIRAVWRLKPFFGLLLAIQILWPPRGHFLTPWLLEHAPALVADWPVQAHRPDWRFGAAISVYQMLQIVTMLLASTLVRASRGGQDFLEGLSGLGVPRSTVELIDATFDGLAESREKRFKSRDDRKADPESPVRSSLRRVIRGDVDWIIDRLADALAMPTSEPRDETTPADRDARFMARVTFVMMSLRLLKVTPGTGMTPGHQNLIVVPLLCVAADRVRRRFAATTIGAATGILTIMLGLGRNGVFIIPAHVLPGIVVDIGWRFIRRSAPGLLGCMILGGIAGFSRFTGMLIVLLLLDNPELLAAVPFFSLGHVVFGVLSGIVTCALIRRIQSREYAQDS